MFPLCRTCAFLQCQSSCTHTDDERTLVGTWVSEEVKLAIKKGYRVTDIYEVYHFKESSISLFRSYFNLFLKITQESSGWPSECVTSEDKLRYIRQYEEREGVKLDERKISRNPGRRQVAKLALKRFWGRWGMSINKGQLTYVHTVPDYNKNLNEYFSFLALVKKILRYKND
ncbi:uncharacterized protein LOC118187028 [Stegodyphus dumicola]|uniref:uncharacterized protein LOC118187028 n=1 Tax=Stegodyphus dumicola TaxID=202533 RepID=UPI0015AB0DFF|nr:uncharacterized protein LOC118187028 [Stegodyphus dumicola]